MTTKSRQNKNVKKNSYELSSLYDDEYYRTGCGIPYERNEHWLQFFGGIADEIIRSLRPKKVLDAGCAWAFLVESLWDRGVESWGIDISPYAISKIRPDMENYCKVNSLTDPIEGKYDLITCIEVLEHMPEKQARTAIKNLTSASNTVLFSSTPKDFDEPTHCNVKPTIYWLKLFAEYSFSPDLTYDASFLTRHAILFHKTTSPPSEDTLILFSEKIRHAIEVEEKINDIQNLNKEYHQQKNNWNIQIANRDQEIINKKEEIEEHKARLVKRDTIISELEIKLHKVHHDSQSSQSALLQKTNQLNAVYSSTSWKLTVPLRKTRKTLRWLKSYIRRGSLISVNIEVSHQTQEISNLECFELTTDLKRTPAGWIILKYKANKNMDIPRLVIYSFIESQLVRLPSVSLETRNNQTFGRVLRIPDNSNQLFVEIINSLDAFSITDMHLREIGKLEALLRLSWKKIKPSITNPRNCIRLALQGVKVFKKHGMTGVKRSLLGDKNIEFSEDHYNNWIERNEKLSEADIVNINKRINMMIQRPVISVLMPVYNTPVVFLKAAIESVSNQLYPYWELCIADDASTDPDICNVLKEYQSKDSRIKVIFRKNNGHISTASNSALELATGKFIALLDHDDELAIHALYLVAETVNLNPDADLIYTDEDKIDSEGKRYAPYFKTSFNPDLILSQNMINHLGVYRRTIIEKIGGFRCGFEGSQDYDLVLRALEEIKITNIHHLPYILYHWRAIPGSVALNRDEKSYAHEKAQKAIEEYLSRRGIKAEVEESPSGVYHRVRYALPDEFPKVTLVVPTRDKLALLRVCVDGILNNTDYSNLEVIIVNNQSIDPDTINYFREIQKTSRVRVINYEKPFNYSAINNFAVKHATGNLIGLINNDIEVIEPSWLKEMVSHALRPEVGVVGAMLYYPNNTIQHAGVALGIGGVAGHLHLNKPRGYFGDFGRTELIQNYSAVTGACMIMRTEIYNEVNGLDAENLSVAFNDIDICIRIREAGYLIVWTPYAEMMHHESASRGSDQSSDKIARFTREVKYMKEKWNTILEKDPFYNPNFSLKDGYYTIATRTRTPKPWLINMKGTHPNVRTSNIILSNEKTIDGT